MYQGQVPGVLWVLGEPGVGKTSLVRGLIEGLALTYVENPKWTLAGARVALAGHYKGGTFDGADTVPYNAADKALEYWDVELRGKYPLTILDGDRFSHDRARDFFASRASVFGVLLEGPPDLVAARRAERGSAQDPSWVAGRRTKSARFFNGFPVDRALRLSAAPSTEELVDRVRRFLAGAPSVLGLEADDGSWMDL